MKIHQIIYLIGVAYLFAACNSSNTFAPTVNQPQQYIQKNLTHHHYKIIDFKTMIDKDTRIKTIYLFIPNSFKAEAAATELPNIRELTHSLLKDFGEKVQVITSAAQIQTYLKNPKLSYRVYILDGALTTYDKTIESESSSLDFSIKLGEANSKNRNKFKNKKKVSQLINDFYVKDKTGLIKYKTSSSIKIRQTSSGYQFGLLLYGANLGISSYKNVKDGLGLSVRKIVEATLIDLIGQIMHIPTYQIMPEIQRKKYVKKPEHLSNYDFCADVEKIVFYPIALKNVKFSQFGMSYESEMNKLKCLRHLYSNNEQKKYKIRLNTIFGEHTNRAQSYDNAKFIQKEITTKVKISRKNLLTQSIPNKRICNTSNGSDYCTFIENRVEIQKIYR